MSEYIEAIRKRAEAAGGMDPIKPGVIAEKFGMANEIFVSHARSDVQFLLDELDRTRKFAVDLLWKYQRAIKPKMVQMDQEMKMKPIEGLDPVALREEVIKEEADKAKGPVKEKMRQIHINLVTWRREKEEMEQKLKKQVEKINKAQAKFDALAKGGDEAWKALGDDQKQGNQQNGQKDEEAD